MVGNVPLGAICINFVFWNLFSISFFDGKSHLVSVLLMNFRVSLETAFQASKPFSGHFYIVWQYLVIVTSRERKLIVTADVFYGLFH